MAKMNRRDRDQDDLFCRSASIGASRLEAFLKISGLPHQAFGSVDQAQLADVDCARGNHLWKSHPEPDPLHAFSLGRLMFALMSPDTVYCTLGM
jgi:hypothetical protein